MDISLITTLELITDKDDALDDIQLCQKCLAMGIKTHRDGFPVDERIKLNETVVKRIDEELARRAKEHQNQSKDCSCPHFAYHGYCSHTFNS